MRKKIYFIVSGFPTKSETFILNHILTAIRSGYSTRILASHRLTMEESSQQDLLRRYNVLRNTFTSPSSMPNNKFHRLMRASKLLVRSERGDLYAYIKALNILRFGRDGLNLSVLYHVDRFIKHKGADLYHAQFGPNGVAVANAKSVGIIKGKILTTFHGYDAHYNKRNLKDLKRYYRRLFAIGDMFTANTPYLAAQLTGLGCPKEKLKILSMGVDTDFFCPDDSKRRGNPTIRLLSVGRLIELKGHSLGIDVVKLLVNRGYDIQYTIVGDGELKDQLQSKIECLRLEEKVQLFGAKSQEEIRDLMRNTDVFLMTSAYDKTGRREAQGVVTLEAQSCGLPIVGFRSGGVPYTIEEGKTGFLVDEMNIEAMAQKVAFLIENEKLRRAFGKSARDFVINNYSMNLCSGKLLDIYSELLTTG